MKNRLMKKIITIICIACTISFLSGCWNRKELTELGIIGAAAIDVSGEDIIVTFEIIKPQQIESEGPQEEPAFFFQSQGKSMFDAARNATLIYDKKLYWSHVNIYYFSEKNASKGIAKYLEYFNRNHEHRRFVNMVIAKDSPASSFIDIGGPKEVLPSKFIEDLFENQKNNGKSVSIKVLEFIKTYYKEGKEPVLGIIQKVKKLPSKDQSDEIKREDLIPSVEGAAVFKKDKLVGYLDGFETRGYNFVVGNIKSGIITVDCPAGEGINSIEIIKASSDMDVNIKEDKYYCSVSIEVSAMLGEATGVCNIYDLQSIRNLAETTSIIIEKEILNSINKAQLYKSDIFGFGEVLHRKYPKHWKEIKNLWNETFSELDFDISVKTNIKRIGVFGEQLTAKERY